jgi:hypothetical protein
MMNYVIKLNVCQMVYVQFVHYFLVEQYINQNVFVGLVRMENIVKNKVKNKNENENV